MVKRKFSSEKVVVSRRIVLTGAAASTSAFILAACGGTVEEGPVATVTRVPAEGAPPTQPPREEPAATPGGEAPPAATEEAATPVESGETGATNGATVGPLIAIDIGWVLGDLSTLAGDAVTLTVAPGTVFDLVNEGAAEHDFVVDDLGIEVHVAPGETAEVTIPGDAALGEYEFYCSIPGHAAAGMVGTLVIAEGAAAPAGEEAAEEEPAGEEGAEEAAAPAAEATVGPLIAIDIGWVLGDLSTLAGDSITLTVSPGTVFDMVSEGAAEHDFVVDDLGIEVHVQPGETVQVTIPEDAALGEYEFYCSIPGHAAAGMVGTLVIEEGGAAVPAEDDAAEEPSEEPAEDDASDDAAAPAAEATVGPLIAIDIGWVLGDLSTLRGDAVTLTVSPGTTFDMVSEGAAEHDFVVDDLGIEVHVNPGETVQVTIPDDAALGEYEFYCSIPGHAAAGMVGTLVVQEGGAATAPAADDDAADEAAAATPEAAADDAAAGAAEVGPLIAIDIGWVLGDLSTLRGDAVSLTVTPGTTFEMISEGAAEHDFVVDDLGIEVHVNPGETAEVTIPEDAAPGEYEFYCSIPGHAAAGMVGTLVVQ